MTGKRTSSVKTRTGSSCVFGVGVGEGAGRLLRLNRQQQPGKQKTKTQDRFMSQDDELPFEDVFLPG